VVKELMETRRTAKPVPGFRGRSGRTFSAKLALEQDAEGKWRVEFDEEWARQPREVPEDDASNGAGQAEPANTSAAATS
jgi:DNA topoisomerase-3